MVSNADILELSARSRNYDHYEKIISQYKYLGEINEDLIYELYHSVLLCDHSAPFIDFN